MNVTVNLHAGQQMVMRGRKRYNVLSCGRRWGKSRMAFALALETAAKGGNSAYACPAAEDYSKRWEEAEEFFAPVAKQFHIADGVIEFKNGKRMEWFGLHRDTGIRGNRYHRFTIDEAAHAPKLEQAWTKAIRATLSDFKGDAFFLSTPNGMNYFKDLFDRSEVNTSYASFQLPTSSNPFIDPKEIEDARKELPSIVFAQEYLAQFISAEGSRVKREWLRYSDTPQIVRYSMGVDLAVSLKTEADYTAIVVVGEDAKGDIHIVDVCRGKWMFNDILAMIRQYADKWRPDAIAIEKVQAQAYVAQELIRTTMLPINPITPVGDKVSRFMPVEGKLEHGHIYLSRGLPLFFEDELLSFPNTDHDDCVDALVYACVGLANNLTIVAL